MKLRGNPMMKRLDRYLGIPTIALLGLRPRRSMPVQLRRIGILRTAAVGDTLLLAGVIADLHAAFPRAEIVLITGENNADAGALVARMGARHLTVPVAHPLAAVRLLRREKMDLLIDTGAWPRLDAVFTALAGARYCVGFRSPGQHRHFAYDAVVRHSDQVHELENFGSILRAIGVQPGNLPTLPADLPSVPFDIPRPFAIFHPWAGGFRSHLREWPEERWVELALRLSTSINTVVVSGTNAERPRAEGLVRVMTARGCSAMSIAGEASLEQLAGTLRQSRVAVSVNTGVMHLAAIAGAATVGLSGPTSTTRWAPIGPRAVSVASAYSGCGFLNLGFEYEGQRTDCMLGISVDAVVEACAPFLS
jgi:heptosyltransferase III